MLLLPFTGEIRTNKTSRCGAHSGEKVEVLFQSRLNQTSRGTFVPIRMSIPSGI